MAMSGKASWRPFREFTKHLPKLLTQLPPKFQDTKLQLNLPEAVLKTRCCGPHCQCGSFCKVPVAQRKKRRFKIRFHGGRPCHPPHCHPLCKKDVLVPRWVAFQGKAVVGLDSAEGQYARCEQYEERARPHGVEGIFRSRFYGSSRCLVPAALYSSAQRVDEALKSASGFLVSLRSEYLSVFTTVGVSAVMRQMIDSLASCFDFERLVHETPTKEQCESFCVVAKELIPNLRNTHWPSDLGAYPVLRQKWNLTYFGLTTVVYFLFAWSTHVF